MISIRIVIILTLAAFAAGCAKTEERGVYVGYVEAEYVFVAAPDAGWLNALHVREGDAVQTGDIIFELESDRERAMRDEAAARLAQTNAQAADIATGARSEEIAALEAQLEEARARQVHARLEMERWMPLVEEDYASAARGDQVTADYKAAIARVKAAEEAIDVAKLAGRGAAREAAAAASISAAAALEQAEWRLSQRTVSTQASGQVEEIYHRKGEFIRAGAPVAAILPPENLIVRFYVPQLDLATLGVGDAVRVKPDGRDEPLTAVVNHIANEAEFTPPVIYSADSREKLVFLVEARLQNGQTLRPGLPVDVYAP